VLAWRSVLDEFTASHSKSRAPLGRLPLRRDGPGRRPGEWLWVAELPDLPRGHALQFTVEDGGAKPTTPPGGEFYHTSLRSFWLQDGQVFAYRPAPQVSPSRVVKVPAFKGVLPARPLYVYLPRGYDEHARRTYPVLYMQDGQNVFHAYEADSHVGSWQADLAADGLIAQGAMREVVIVGVGHGGAERLAEYLPPFATMKAPRPEPAPRARLRPRRRAASLAPVVLRGRADRTLAFYQRDVGSYLHRNYRISTDRSETGLCGSSMGGLFSLYVAFEHPQLARHYAALSPALGLARDQAGEPALRARLGSGPITDVRLWIDSGTQDEPGKGTDGREETRAFWDSLQARGASAGPDFQYHLFEGALHHESDWAARLPKVLRFLFPAVGRSV
jgi:predicted alpha/beta superfamily hydrolase